MAKKAEPPLKEGHLRTGGPIALRSTPAVKRRATTKGNASKAFKKVTAPVLRWED